MRFVAFFILALIPCVIALCPDIRRTLSHVALVPVSPASAFSVDIPLSEFTAVVNCIISLSSCIIQVYDDVKFSESLVGLLRSDVLSVTYSVEMLYALYKFCLSS